VRGKEQTTNTQISTRDEEWRRKVHEVDSVLHALRVAARQKREGRRVGDSRHGELRKNRVINRSPSASQP
jgi:hypothetical protein